MRSTRCFLAFLVLSLVVLPAARAAAAGSKERLAQKACLSGNVQKGVEILSDLYIETKNPLFIYNQGRCFEQNGRCQDAIPRFKEYLRKATKASAEDRAEAQQHIADCQVGLEQKTAAPAPEQQPPQPTVPAAPPLPSAPQATEPPPAPIAAVQQPTESLRHHLQDEPDRSTLRQCRGKLRPMRQPPDLPERPLCLSLHHAVPLR